MWFKMIIVLAMIWHEKHNLEHLHLVVKTT